MHVNIIPSSILIDPIEKKKVLENELLYIILTSQKDIAWGYCNHITNTNSVCQWAHNDFKIISIETIAWAFLEL